MHHILQLAKFTIFGGALVSILACTDEGGNQAEKPKAPWVMELHVIPTNITINPDKFYPKPFTVRAKYSNATVTNVTKTMQWVSENSTLLDLNKKGELVATGNCEKEKCAVFLVGTDPGSGKSIRVLVNISPKKKA